MISTISVESYKLKNGVPALESNKDIDLCFRVTDDRIEAFDLSMNRKETFRYHTYVDDSQDGRIHVNKESKDVIGITKESITYFRQSVGKLTIYKRKKDG